MGQKQVSFDEQMHASAVHFLLSEKETEAALALLSCEVDLNNLSFFCITAVHRQAALQSCDANRKKTTDKWLRQGCFGETRERIVQISVLLITSARMKHSPIKQSYHLPAR